MKNIIQLIFLTLAFSCMVTRSYGQDPMYSVYWNDNAYLNPARVGEKEDAIYSFLHSRIQWPNVISKFHTFSGGIDIGLPNNGDGIGLRILSNIEGEGYQRTVEAAFTYAKRLELSDEYQVSLGLSGGFISKTIDPTRLVFTDQLDPVFGVIYPTAAPVGTIDNASNLNFSSGISFLRWSRGGKCDKEPIFNIGVAAHNMTRPKLSLVEEQSQWPIRFTGYFEYNLMNDDFRKWSSINGMVFSLRPSVIVSTQRGPQQ
jgi:type IX secretion system PorP/SprF family membrane protein